MFSRIVDNMEKENEVLKEALVKLKDVSTGEFPVCTLSHFFETILDLSEDVFPNVGKNPFWQKEVDWNKIKLMEETPKGEPKIYD